MAYLVLLALPFLLLGGLISWAIEWTGLLVNWLRDRRARRAARIEAELDRTQMQLRATILQLANQLGGDAHEARKALIRESFLASGKVPPTQL
ncbi:hypothetical protein [Galbitalea soli]|uniref:Uncharacterized protein n=1 Tax=Galbitalea soli TaxID=1268042 RepID=A0A7C9PML6_9MICO|nr:hypothetical protein [Galbitalea soli]NEM90907.1 hypothetical protein [Galbitalea soli]NYJ31631.1 hypothetical protein [Galbitalea soli]